MAAECALADCAAADDGAVAADDGAVAAAVAQCHHCGRDFCAAHRYVGVHGAAARHLCTDCGVAEAEDRAYSCREREESLAIIRTLAHSLVDEGFSAPDVYTWTRRTEHRWWAFGRFGRYQVAVPEKHGWLVGDYPWAGMVNHGPRLSSSEVFVKPTYVDPLGRIEPLDATRATVMDDELFTAQLCQDIADTMAEIAAATRENAHAAENPSQ